MNEIPEKFIKQQGRRFCHFCKYKDRCERQQLESCELDPYLETQGFINDICQAIESGQVRLSGEVGRCGRIEELTDWTQHVINYHGAWLFIALRSREEKV
jgi:hypothetical protein